MGHSGSFHGGSSHTGSHHSGGFGSFGGGSSHSSSSHSNSGHSSFGGGSRDSYGDIHYSDGDIPVWLYIAAACLLPIIIIPGAEQILFFFIFNIGFDLALIAFGISLLINRENNILESGIWMDSYFSVLDTWGTASRYAPISTTLIHKKDFYKRIKGMKATTDGVSWYTSTDFSLELSDEYNINRLLELSLEQRFLMRKRMPYRTVQVLLILVPAGYDLWITPFENMIMSDFAFALVDFSLYFLPAMLILGLGILRVFHHNKIYERIRSICKSIIDQNIAENRVVELKEDIEELMKKNWYYNTCPNCSADAGPRDEVCASCGSSLLISRFKLQKVAEEERHSGVPQDNVGQKIKRRVASRTNARAETAVYTSVPTEKKKEYWFYNVCPKCETEASPTDTKCQKCGNTLLVYTRMLIAVPQKQRHLGEWKRETTSETEETQM